MGKQLFYIKGMRRDLDPAKSSSEYAYEIRNMRINAQEDSTFLELVSERGNTQYTIHIFDLDLGTLHPIDPDMLGFIVGYYVLNNNIILFTKEINTDVCHIFKLFSIPSNDNILHCFELYRGNLGFTKDTRLEILGIYENDAIQKVYFIDGVHQPRFINVATNDRLVNASLDFVQSMLLNETVSISKSNVLGLFPSGTIQYVMCYYNKYGQISNPFYISDLHYLSFDNRGGSPEESINNAFNIQIVNTDPNWEYLRVYSIIRTSENGTPISKKVIDVSNDSRTINIVDNGMIGESVDNTEILMLTQAAISPKAMVQKDNTLFFGNITTTDFFIQNTDILEGTVINFDYNDADYIDIGEINTQYSYKNELGLGAADIAGFKTGETYYFGVIVQNYLGQWSNVLPIGSATVPDNMYIIEHNGTVKFRPIKPTFLFTSEGVAFLHQYNRCKFVILDTYPTVWGQGILCPTLFNKERFQDNTYSYSSWYFRTLNGPVPYKIQSNFPQNAHHYNIRNTEYFSDDDDLELENSGEIFGASYDEVVYDKVNSISQFNDCDFFVDWNILTLHSPEIEFGDNTLNYDSLQIIGVVPITSTATNMTLSLATPLSTQNINWNLYNPIIIPNKSDLGYKTDLCRYTFGLTTARRYPVYPWHASRGMTTESKPADAEWYGLLKNKVFSTLRQSLYPTYFIHKGFSYNIGKLNIYQDDNTVLRLNNNKLYSGFGDILKITDNWTFRDTLDYSGLSDGDPVRIKYKSTKHGVVELGKYNDVEIIPPNIHGITAITPDVEDEELVNNQPTQPLIAIIPDIPDEYTVSSTDNIENIIKLVISKEEFDEYWSFDVSSDNWVASNTEKYVNMATGDLIAVTDFTNNKTEIFCLLALYPTASFITIPRLIKENRTLAYTILHLPGSPLGDYNVWDKNANACIYKILTVSPQTTVIGGVILFKDYNNSICEMYINHSTTEYLISSFLEDTPQWVSYSYFYSVAFEPTAKILNIPSRRISTTAEHITIPSSLHTYGCLYLAELKVNSIIQPVIDETSVWKPASLSIKTSLIDSDTFLTHQSSQNAFLGDTFFQRYDCLKTYPYTLEDPNQIVEIMSFMCETRINIDGRYDNRRGQLGNTSVLNTNFNLLNKVYSQKDNFFTFHWLDSSNYNISKFPNQLMWSKAKINGSIIDTWTSIPQTSFLDLDGTLGEITSIKLWNDNIICFQDRGISQILYNERTTISTEQGLPIEIANSGKVSGAKYISNLIGCSNKDSVVTTSNGIYFTDDNTSDIYLLSQGLRPLFKEKGFNQYLYSRKSLEGQTASYDPIAREVYFNFKETEQKNNSRIIKHAESLVYNEQLGEFVTFLDYVPKYLFEYNNFLLAIPEDSKDDNGFWINSSLWRQFSGEYLNFFGNDNNTYSIDIISSENPTIDKIFTNVEFRADVLKSPYFDKQFNILYPQATTLDGRNLIPFDSMNVINEYQRADTVFVDTLRKNNSISQKFRIWRCNIARDNFSNNLNRIRGLWAKIHLQGSIKGINKTVVHDIGVIYM